MTHIKSTENNLLYKTHNKISTKYISSVYILDKTTVPDSVKNMFIEKVLEKNSDELYGSSMRLPENLSAFEKLILENFYSKQNKKLKWRCSKYLKEGKIFIKLSINPVEQKIPAGQGYKETCFNLNIIDTSKTCWYIKCEVNFNVPQATLTKKNIMKWQYYKFERQSYSQKINMDDNDSNISKYQISLNNSIKLKFLSYSTQIQMNSSDFINTISNEYITIRNYKQITKDIEQKM